jgi:hypothetical protein
VSAPAPRRDTTRLRRLVHSDRAAAALRAAVELGLFTQVVRGADTEATVARALDLTETSTRSTRAGPTSSAPASATSPRTSSCRASSRG